MKPWKIAVALATTLAIAGPAWAQGDVIAARRDGMKGAGRHMEMIKTVLDQRGDPRASAASIAEMMRLFDGLPERFPAGSGSGDTRALPAIWTDRAGFEAASALILTQLRALQGAASAGDQAGLAAAFQQVSGSCNTCHRAYRGPAR